MAARPSKWTGAPSFADVLAARDFLRAYLAPTPLIRRDAVSSALGLDVWLKCESLLPTAAFKVRGGLNLIGRDPTAKAGVMGASTGNHGQSLAYAGGVFGVPVTIFVPKGANPLKVAAMRVSGATIVEHGDDYDDAREECERRAAATGTRYVHSGNEPYLIAGVATAALEVLLEKPDLDVLIVPVGGGSGASGAALVAKTLRPEVAVIGVQAEGASAAYRAWRDHAPRTTERADTFAEGLATRTSFELPQRMLAVLLDDFVLVSDDELYAAMRLLLIEGHLVTEGAGAAAVAAARRLAERLAGKRVACWVSGANATADSLRHAMDQR
ncbi:MAG: pyridoxal-phosphate dependent enzyme [Chloroflexi bacterium]|nr:MAG: pyridoxal-phosphate dependent enzyme [Chloroflexota bacterium]